MAIKELKKAVTNGSPTNDKSVERFISKGGSLANNDAQQGDHRLTLRIPQHLMKKIDEKRTSSKLGRISRNLWILQLIEKSTRQ